MPPILYKKAEVVSCLGISPSEFKKKLVEGIIPPPVGRKGNTHLWKSTWIHAVAQSIRAYGDDHDKQKTVDIMFKDLLAFEAQ